ncbi:MAG: C25 family cysteine peptidase [Candidatus Krumholzibacteriota bacterium]|nr:C25 family cysteine peptidase [Candidatus Krumholzibacteriota bacterium]
MKLKTASFILLLICASLPFSLYSAEVSVVYHFDTPYVMNNSKGFSRIIFPNTIQAANPGEPSVPYRKAQILLPAGQKAIDVRIEKRNWEKIGSRCRLHPRQHVVPGDLRSGGRGGFIYKSSSYNIDKWIYPPVSNFSTHYLRGHPIATGSFSPVGFHPSADEAGYFKEIKVTIVTTSEYSSSGIMPKSDKETVTRLKKLVDNPSGADLPCHPAAEGDYQYLIVTSDSFEDDFSELADFYNRRGFLTQIMTVENIESAYSGEDTAEKIRNAVISEYSQHSITHLLLGGDGDGEAGNSGIVPYRGLYGAVQSSSLYEIADIPSDIYYAALDGSWNSDSDSLWGEPGEEDFYSEIAVGRACVGNADDIAAFINKTTMYQESPVVSDLKTATLYGEKLYDSPLTYGGDEMDQLIDTCSAYGFSTEGIPIDFNITKYYDRDTTPWDETAVFNAISSGSNWIAHSGHANQTYVMRITNYDITTSNFLNDGQNANFPIIYSYGCYSGAFDYDDCVGEDMVSNQHCAAAFLGNSRYGWFTEGTTNGPSHHFQREFYDAVFTEGITTLGAANQRSKDETVPFIDLPDEYEPGAHRWCFYTLNLIGDPAMDGWTDTPEQIYATHATSIERSDTVFTVGTDVGGSVGALYWNGVCYSRGTADGTGDITLNLSSAIPAGVDSIVLTVTSHNYHTYRDTIMVEDTTGSDNPSFHLRLAQNTPNPFNPSTTITFSIPRSGHVDLRIFDITGREVDCLIDENLEAKSYSIDWRPSNLASGIYLYRLKTREGTKSRKAILLR